jgi:hypothetical protein
MANSSIDLILVSAPKESGVIPVYAKIRKESKKFNTYAKAKNQ